MLILWCHVNLSLYWFRVILNALIRICNANLTAICNVLSMHCKPFFTYQILTITLRHVAASTLLDRCWLYLNVKLRTGHLVLILLLYKGVDKILLQFYIHLSDSFHKFNSVFTNVISYCGSPIIFISRLF